MAVPFIFDQQQLDLFDLNASNFSAENLRKQYRMRILQWHPDKGGNDFQFREGLAAYQDLLGGLGTFGVWLGVTPELTLAETIRPRPIQSRGSSSAAQPAPDLAPAPELAPTFCAASQCQLFRSLEEALQEMNFTFNFSVADMAKILRRTPVGKAATFIQSGAARPDPIRFHGTHFRAMIAISRSGFLPVWGAGRGKALEKFCQDKPVVYTSSVADQALWYPQAMVNAKGNRVGELVCLNERPMRVMLICAADVDKRRICIRRKNNKQDAWLPEDIEVRGVMFFMMNDGINEPKPTPRPEARGGVWTNGQCPVDLESSDDEPVPQGETSAAQPGGFEAYVPQQLCDKEVETSSDESGSWFNGSQPCSEPSSKRPRTGAAPAGSVPSTTSSPTIAAQRGPKRAAVPATTSSPTTAAQCDPKRADDNVCWQDGEVISPTSLFIGRKLMMKQQIKSKVARQCMLLRIHKDDHRLNADIAYDYAQLVLLRQKYVQRKGLDWEDPLSEQDQKNIWKNELYWLFRSERPEDCCRKERQLHSVFRVWLRASFGNVEAIRDICERLVLGTHGTKSSPARTS